MKIQLSLASRIIRERGDLFNMFGKISLNGGDWMP
jgi:hypothetical protein